MTGHSIEDSNPVFAADATDCHFPELAGCTCCPRECRADRYSSQRGFCRSGAGFSVGAICAHRGEEPVISGSMGICNVFFTRCNLQCVYCQNYEISRTSPLVEHRMDLDQVVGHIERHLAAGCKSVGFVSASHVIPQMRAIVDRLGHRSDRPVLVYNTNSYDKVETVRSLEGVIDVYLPDLKYLDAHLAGEYSQAADYPPVATSAIREMFRQKGAGIELDDDGLITSGLIIRHLVLPGHIENSRAVLHHIATELSTDMHLSLMSQYCPTPAVAGHPILGRRLTREEYDDVLHEAESLGFHRGFVQELSSADHYRPDFRRTRPFER